MRAVVLVLVLGLALVAGGCGRSAAPPPPTRSTIGGELLDPGAGSGDVVVATVSGRPVWASCVEGHMRARGVDRDRALNDCIDLELLAAAALARGVLDDPDMQSDLRAAIVDGFVGEEFEDKTQVAADLPAAMVDKTVAAHAGEMNRPEARLAIYARALWRPEDKGKKQHARVVPPLDSPEDKAAHALADAIYAELAGHDDLFPEDLRAAVERVAGKAPYEYSDQPYPMFKGYPAGTDPAFVEAAFALPGIGYVSPPTRTGFGWDLILITDIQPPQTKTRDELVAELFPAMRRQYFDLVWTVQLATGHAIEEYADRLEEPDEAAGSGAAGSGAAGSGAAP
jgi:hypothetical protein